MEIKNRKQYPKVLIVNGEPINSLTASGLTMKNLFLDWPSECLAQIHTHEISSNVNCYFTYRVTLMDLNLPVSLLKLIIRQTNEFKSVQANNDISIEESTNSSNKYGKASFGRVRSDIYTLLNLAPFKLQTNLYVSCNEFKPDIIYSMLGSIEIMKLAIHLSNRCKIPIIPHFMDDWPSTKSRNFPFAPLFLPIQEWLLKKIVREAPLALSICDAMSNDYEKRFKHEFYSFMNCVDTSYDISPSNMCETTCVRFGYVGGLHLNRWRSLRDIADCLQKIKFEGYNVKLEIFAPSNDLEKYGHILSANSVVSIGGTLTSDKVHGQLQKFDVLLHIESFNKSDRLFTKFSISTKIPQYMSSGKPILAYGPEEVASCRYIKESNCGVVVGNENFDLLLESLKLMTVDKTFRDNLGSNGRKIALTKHNAEIEREKLRKLLHSVVVNSNK